VVEEMSQPSGKPLDEPPATSAHVQPQAIPLLRGQVSRSRHRCKDRKIMDVLSLSRTSGKDTGQEETMNVAPISVRQEARNATCSKATLPYEGATTGSRRYCSSGIGYTDTRTTTCVLPSSGLATNYARCP
jgi:hypothetical protein